MSLAVSVEALVSFSWLSLQRLLRYVLLMKLSSHRVADVTEGAQRTIRINLMEGAVMLGVCLGGLLGLLAHRRHILITLQGGLFVSDLGFAITLLIPVCFALCS